jgi:hypothetical protein
VCDAPTTETTTNIINDTSTSDLLKTIAFLLQTTAGRENCRQRIDPGDLASFRSKKRGEVLFLPFFNMAHFPPSPPESAPPTAPLVAAVITDKKDVVDNATRKFSASKESGVSSSLSKAPLPRKNDNNNNNNNNNNSGSKPSILRKNIGRLRRRKRPTEDEATCFLPLDDSVEEEKNNRPISDASSDNVQERSPSPRDEQDDAEEAKLESILSNDDDNVTSKKSPKISIVLAHDNEVVVEQLLPHAAAAGQKTPKSATKTPTDQPAELFYSPLQLISPPLKRTSTATSMTPPQPKGIIKRHSSNSRLSSSSLGSLETPSTANSSCRRRVSFDETTIVKQERQQKPKLEGVRMAMPIILPYLIAVLILILSSLVPPAAPPQVPPETTTGKAPKRFLSNFVTVSVRSFSPTTTEEETLSETTTKTEEASLSSRMLFSSSSSPSSPVVGDDGTNHTTTAPRSRGSMLRQNLTEALWTPHSVYDRIVTTAPTGN